MFRKLVRQKFLSAAIVVSVVAVQLLSVYSIAFPEEGGNPCDEIDLTSCVFSCPLNQYCMNSADVSCKFCVWPLSDVFACGYAQEFNPSDAVIRDSGVGPKTDKAATCQEVICYKSQGCRAGLASIITICSDATGCTTTVFPYVYCRTCSKVGTVINDIVPDFACSDCPS